MQDFLQTLLTAVVTAALPIVSAYVITLVQKAAEKAKAETESTNAQRYIGEIAEAISDAVSATSQTYVDALKQAGTFTPEAQKEAAQKALVACLASISPAAQEFIESAYGDIKEYLTTKIEAEVRKQKLSYGIPIAAVQESASDTTAVAASAAAATAASYLQTAINQIESKAE